MTGRKMKIACIQMRATEDVAENIGAASDFIRKAAKDGAEVIATPENTNLMAADAGAKLEKSFTEDKDPALPAFAKLANELNIWLLIGSLAIKVDETKTANRCYLLGPDGKTRAHYDKIHLFDVDLPSGKSATVKAPAAGTYKFHCKIHTTMHGTLEVS